MKIESGKMLGLLAETKQSADNLSDTAYKSGYIAAISYMEGLIAIEEEASKAKRCGNCKWLGKTQHASFRICNNPKKRFRTGTSHFKYRSSLACKLFEEEEDV